MCVRTVACSEASLARPPVGSWVGIRYSVTVSGIRPSRRSPLAGWPPLLEGVGACDGLVVLLDAAALEEDPVVCSEAPLARPRVSNPRGGVWWDPGYPCSPPLPQLPSVIIAPLVCSVCYCAVSSPTSISTRCGRSTEVRRRVPPLER